VKCLENGGYLEVDEAKDTDYIYKEGGNDKEYIEVTPDIETELAHWKLATDDLKKHQEAVDYWKTKIKKRIGDNYGIKDSEGNTRVVWAKRKKGRAIIPYFNTPSGNGNE
jgi:N-acetylmuramoyl-L-alanine amidase CwlA